MQLLQDTINVTIDYGILIISEIWYIYYFILFIMLLCVSTNLPTYNYFRYQLKSYNFLFF